MKKLRQTVGLYENPPYSNVTDFRAEAEMIKRAALATTALLALVGAASAADLPTTKSAPAMPPAALINWNGFYIGVNGGWVGSTGDSVFNTGTDTGPGGLGTVLIAGLIPGSVGVSYSGGLVGGTIGYNYQISPSWVMGVEGDFDWVGASGSTSAVFPGGAGFVPFTTRFSRALDALGTLRTRVGFLWTPSFLVYSTGGLAFGETKLGTTFICAACGPPASTEPSTSVSSTNWRVGWTTGVGGEWKFAPNWSFKAEYLYVDLGNQKNTITYTYGANTSTLTSRVTNHDNIVRAGVNLSF